MGSSTENIKTTTEQYEIIIEKIVEAIKMQGTIG